MEPLYFDHLARFADEIMPDTDRLDGDGDTLGEWYDEWARRDLHVGGGPLQPFAGTDFCDVLVTLGKASGAFGFVALQQFVANFSLGERHRTNVVCRSGRTTCWPSALLARSSARTPTACSTRRR